MGNEQDTNMTGKMEWAFIVNPVAGSRFAASYTDKVKEMIHRYDVKARIVLTKHKGHGTELAAEFATKGFRYIIAVGGDGTVNEVAKGLVGKDRIIMGVISAGTGNDFNQILGFPERFNNEDWETFFKKNVIGIDVGSCNGNIFLNGMGLGFDAQVAAENIKDQSKMRKSGKNRYIWHIIKTILYYKEQPMTIIADGQIKQTGCFMNTIANGRRFAGGFMVTPRAIANDGLLDICMIKKLSLPQRFNMLRKVPGGSHIGDKKVTYYRTGRLRIEFDTEVPHHLDGEIFFSAVFDVKILPTKLNMIYNATGNHFFNI